MGKIRVARGFRAGEEVHLVGGGWRWIEKAISTNNKNAGRGKARDSGKAV